MDRIYFFSHHAVIRRRHTTDPINALFALQRSDDAEADPNTTIEVQYGSNLTGCNNAVHDGDNVIITVDDQSPNDNVTVKLKRSSLAPVSMWWSPGLDRSHLFLTDMWMAGVHPSPASDLEPARLHLKIIYTKMHVRSRTEAVARCMSKEPA